MNWEVLEWVDALLQYTSNGTELLLMAGRFCQKQLMEYHAEINIHINNVIFYLALIILN